MALLYTLTKSSGLAIITAFLSSLSIGKFEDTFYISAHFLLMTEDSYILHTPKLTTHFINVSLY